MLLSRRFAYRDNAFQAVYQGRYGDLGQVAYRWLRKSTNQ